MMNRSQRADLGLISSVLREQRRALRPRVRSGHGREPLPKTGTLIDVATWAAGVVEQGQTRRSPRSGP